MSEKPDVLVELRRLRGIHRRALTQSAPYGSATKNRARIDAFDAAIAEIERLRAIIAEDDRLELERVAEEFRMTGPRVRVSVPLCQQIGVAWAEVPP